MQLWKQYDILPGTVLLSSSSFNILVSAQSPNNTCNLLAFTHWDSLFWFPFHTPTCWRPHHMYPQHDTAACLLVDLLMPEAAAQQICARDLGKDRRNENAKGETRCSKTAAVLPCRMPFNSWLYFCYLLPPIHTNRNPKAFNGYMYDTVIVWQDKWSVRT